MHPRDRNDINWRKLEAMARRGWGRFGGGGGRGFGDWGGFGDNFRIGRMLASGDLRLVALYFIEEQPRHGYDLIKAIEEKTAGFYSPSPGIVYPALTFLEEAGYVTSSAEGNKKLYTITEAGRAYLSDNREAVHSTLDFLGKAGERMREWRERAGHEMGWGPRDGAGRGPGGDRDIPNVIPEVNDARKALKSAIAEALDSADEAAQRRLADILNTAADRIRRGDVDLG
jgi:DNA-binding PadR family transcriptional regulator